jgi:DNA-directed RNA polymerase subunit RPC12/RpoP
MVGICIELKTSCKHCSAALMLNAYTEDILCPSCNQTNNFTAETWQSLIEDAVKEAPKFKVGEGQPSTIMRGEYTYSLTYGRQEPRCGKCKTGIDVSKIEEYSTKGNASCTKCSNVIFVRKPNEMISEAFSSVKYLVGEDDDLLSVNKAGADVPASSKPILFTCPSCAGNLQIDGTNRMVDCKYCDSQIYLPDDLWFRLHPAKIVERWYMLVEGSPGKKKTAPGGKPVIELPDWYNISDVACDKNGNIYVASATDGESDAIVWSMTPKLEVRWVREGLKFKHDRTGICLTHDKNLYLWDSSKHSLVKLSSKDGSTLKKIDGDQTRLRLNMMGCTSVVSCHDGTILCIINNTFARFRENGERVDLWKARKFGIFSSGKGSAVPDTDEYAPYIKDIGSSPKRVSGDFTKMQVGHDGFLYMIDKSSSDGEVAKYDMDGTQIWSKFIPLQDKDCKACTDSSGNVFVLGRKDQNGRMVRLNAKTLHFDTVVKDIKEGGSLNDEDLLAVAPNGTAYAFKYYNRLKVFLPDMKMFYRSKQAEEDDNELLKKKKEAIEKDEDFC